MGFSELDWPQDSQLFPKHETVTEYIERYAEDVKHLVTFGTQVLDIRATTSAQSGDTHWLVKRQQIKPTNDGEIIESEYDAVVVASGHFSVPFIPEVKGMKEWSQRYPGIISHSMYYKKPEDYQDKVSFLRSIF